MQSTGSIESFKKVDSVQKNPTLAVPMSRGFKGVINKLTSNKSSSDDINITLNEPTLRSKDFRRLTHQLNEK